MTLPLLQEKYSLNQDFRILGFTGKYSLNQDLQDFRIYRKIQSESGFAGF
jgi:hypothetical protein